MMDWYNRKRASSAGSVVLTLLGILSVMVILVLTTSQRMSGHTRVLTIIDQTQIARFFLESYSGDVISQIKQTCNASGTQVYEAFRSLDEKSMGGKSESVPIDPAFYKPSKLLEEIAGNQEIEILGQPDIKLGSLTTLLYPPCLIVDQLRERTGNIQVVCSARFSGRTYTLRAVFPFKLVTYLTPMLREFVLFVDKLHLEQTEAFGAPDKLNILFTKLSDTPTQKENDAKIPIPPECADYTGRPWSLFQNPFTKEEFMHQNGKVFLGDDDHSIFLNLAGELHFNSYDGDGKKGEGYLSELWTIRESLFPVNHDNSKFVSLPLGRTQGGNIQNTVNSLNIIQKNGHYSSLCPYGFSAELEDTPDGLFQGATTLESIVGNDPFYQRVSQERFRLKLSSGFRLFGKNFGPDLEGAPPPEPMRLIFGNVFSRFFQITWWFPPGDIPTSLDYDDTAWGNDSFTPPPFDPTGTNFKVFHWEPPPNDSYCHFMSQLVSPGDPSAKNRWNFPMNPTDEGVLSAKQFKGTDNTHISGKFSDFGGQWFGKPGSEKAALGTVFPRISRYFASTTELLDYAGFNRNPQKFWIDGVVYCNGPLDLPDITTADVRGGIILVNGPISLGRITRGMPSPDTVEGLNGLKRMVPKIPQEKILTFVSLTGEKISLREDILAGVHLISLKPDLNTVTDQIAFEKGVYVGLLGGVAVSTLNLAKRVKEFQMIPLFLFPTSMASESPSLSASIVPEMERYELYVE